MAVVKPNLGRYAERAYNSLSFHEAYAQALADPRTA